MTRARQAWCIGLAAFAISLALAAEPRSVMDATLCDLAERPLEFANRHVRVAATIVVGLEHFVLTDDRCQLADRARMVWLEYPGQSGAFTFARGWTASRFDAAFRLGELNGDGPSVQWEAPAEVSEIDPKQRKNLDKALKRGKGAGVTALVTGRYDYAGDGLLVRSAYGQFRQTSAYGHQECCAGRIVLESVEVTHEGK